VSHATRLPPRYATRLPPQCEIRFCHSEFSWLRSPLGTGFNNSFSEWPPCHAPCPCPSVRRSSVVVNSVKNSPPSRLNSNCPTTPCGRSGTFTAPTARPASPPAIRRALGPLPHTTLPSWRAPANSNGSIRTGEPASSGSSSERNLLIRTSHQFEHSNIVSALPGSIGRGGDGRPVRGAYRPAESMRSGRSMPSRRPSSPTAARPVG
jgi:hypothetical protein